MDRIVVRLDPNIPFEKTVLDDYHKTPRARRQEWIRKVLEAGLIAMRNGTTADKTLESGLTNSVLAPAAREPAIQISSDAESSGSSSSASSVGGATADSAFTGTPVPARQALTGFFHNKSMQEGA